MDCIYGDSVVAVAVVVDPSLRQVTNLKKKESTENRKTEKRSNDESVKGAGNLNKTALYAYT